MRLLRLKTMPNQFLNNSKTNLTKSKCWFFDPKIDKIDPLKGQNLIFNFHFKSHISSFQTENTAKNERFKAKSNAFTATE